PADEKIAPSTDTPSTVPICRNVVPVPDAMPSSSAGTAARKSREICPMTRPMDSPSSPSGSRRNQYDVAGPATRASQARAAAWQARPITTTGRPPIRRTGERAAERGHRGGQKQRQSIRERRIKPAGLQKLGHQEKRAEQPEGH